MGREVLGAIFITSWCPVQLNMGDFPAIIGQLAKIINRFCLNILKAVVKFDIVMQVPSVISTVLRHTTYQYSKRKVNSIWICF